MGRPFFNFMGGDFDEMGNFMKITVYRAELDVNRHNVLVEERSCECSSDSLGYPETVADMLKTVFRLDRQAEEYVYLIALNNKSRPLGVFEISHGTVDQAIYNPGEIFIKALLCGASGIILAHNHPSGDATPSSDDKVGYKRVVKAGELMGVSLLDYIIIGDDYYSFMEHGLN